MMQRRRRLIRSGHFGALRESNSGKKEGMMTVRRARQVHSGSVEDVTNSSIMLNLSYVIYRPDLIHSSKSKKPLLVIHGGPSIPSDYLQPMSKDLIDRCVIFYDQIGCGNSSIPNDLSFYSIENAVNDLECFIQHLTMKHSLKDFHLYGHSFGGIVAYEYSKLQCEKHTVYTESCRSISLEEDPHDTKPTLLSITLCSTPSNMREVEEESKLLLDSFIPSFSNVSSNNANGDEHEEEEIYKTASFQKEFVCRTNDGILPLPLQEAYKKKGNIWEGHDAIIDYVAQPLKSSSSTVLTLPPAMLLRGEHDFISEKYGVDEWRQLMNHNSVITHSLKDSSHYSMLENPSQHSTTLSTFLSEQEICSSVPSVTQ